MKPLLLLLLLGLCSRGSYAQTQASLNQQGSTSYQRADQELNRTYQQVLQAYHADPAFLAKLKVAQQRWLQFRDAEVQARYPAADPFVAYGSSYPACRAKVLEILTRARTQQLRLWLTGIPEGDVCTGSVKMVRGK